VEGEQRTPDKPELLLEEISIDGLQWLCQELKIEW
jgi:mycofactocin precursor